MRPENSSKLWLKTRCERSRDSTAWSSVTPFRPDAIAGCEIPLAAASFLKSSSQAWKLPAPQAAAKAGAAGIVSTARQGQCTDETKGQQGSHQNHSLSGVMTTRP